MRDFFNVFHYGPQNFLFSIKNLPQSIFSFGNNFLIRLYFLASQVMSKANLLDRTSLIIVFGSTQREGKLTGSSLIVAIVSSFSSSGSDKMHALLFILIIQIFVPFLSLVDSYTSLLVYSQPGFDSETGAYRGSQIT